MDYSTKRSNRHFLRAMLSRSISSVNHTTVRHEFSIPALRSLATGRWARGLHRNTNAYPPALERVLTAKMQSKLTIALTHAATFGRASRLFKVPCVSSGRLHLGGHIQNWRSRDLELRENDLRRHAGNGYSINSSPRARSVGDRRQHSVQFRLGIRTTSVSFDHLIGDCTWRDDPWRAVTKLSNTWHDARTP